MTDPIGRVLGRPLRRSLHGAVTLGCMLVALVVTGCVDDEIELPPPLPTVTTAATPVDRTLPGELAEGRIEAFGLKLPRGMKTTARMDDSWFVEGLLGAEDVANYFRERLEPERIETGPQKTVFVNAKVKADPTKVVRVEVTRLSNRAVEVVVRNRVREKAEPGLTEEERWRKAGVTPDGKVLPGME